MFLILVLSTLSSGADYAIAQSAPENFELATKNTELKSKSFTVGLTEKIGFTETKKQFNQSKNHSVSLQEKISASNNSLHEEIILIKYDSDRKIMMERILDRQSKLKINESELLDNLPPSTLVSHEEIVDDVQILMDHSQLFDKLYFGINDLIPNIFESGNLILNFKNNDHNILIQNNIKILNDQIFDPNNPILLILLIPFAGFVLIRYDNEQTKFYQIKQFFTFAFIVILLSSAVITPMSISSSYWGYAFAEMDNGTEIISQLEDTEIVSQENFTNTSDIDSNLLGIDFSEHVTSQTHSSQSINQMSISDILSVTLSQFTGNTIPDETDSSSTDSNMSISDVLEIIFTPGFTINDATLSLPFDSIENGTASDNAQINDENSLLLDGDQDFIHLNENSTNNLQSLVIGAWIKPDYSQGSPEFTVVSKEKSFSLSVDNQPSSHAAKFSIFDGIKWSEIQSNSQIPEEWTHVVASFSNQTLSIYINGQITGTKQIDGILSLSFDGQLETVDIDSISSDSSIVVGAYMTTKSGVLVPNNMFSGMIDDVALFDSAISDTQIEQLYSSGIDSHTTQTKSLDDIIREMEIEAGIYLNSTNQTLQAQLSISDSVSYIHSQAQN
ncbi:hypothetical protein C6990_01840, partial [Nitrosopumilus sp. b3]|uniref:LamG domain-containing protein n=1 Tax=Nitrosopumilus sp. b3 TaxID=2109909 RepID=UPI001C712508